MSLSVRRNDEAFVPFVCEYAIADSQLVDTFGETGSMLCSVACFWKFEYLVVDTINKLIDE